MLLRHYFAALAVAIGIGGVAQASPITSTPEFDKIQTAYAHYRHYAHRHPNYRRAYYRRAGYRRPVRVVRYYQPYRYGYYRPARVARYGYPAYRPYRSGYYRRPYGYYGGYGPRYYPRSGVSISVGF
jgi:hypothetical protein